jgi:hypothetical protein
MTDRGCFALPSTYSLESKTCKACVAHAECGARVQETLQRIRGTINVEQLIAQFHVGEDAPSLTLAQRTKVASMPVHVARRLETLFLNGFDRTARSLFANSENPFPATGAKHLRLAGNLLLQGGFTKKHLRTECQKRFGWAESTAFVEVARTLALLRGLGLIVERDGRMVLADTTT